VGWTDYPAANDIPAYVARFHHHHGRSLLAAADFTVARAGAASLAEIASFELPSSHPSVYCAVRTLCRYAR